MLSARTLTRSVLAAVVFSLAASTLAAAQQRAPVERPEPAQAPPQVFVDQSQDARETRESLEELIKRLPPAVGRVLRTDPSLLSNEAYLATYPALAAFLKQHPEIRNSPGFFFEHIGPTEFYSPSQPETRESQAIRIWRDLMQFLAISGVFLTVTGALIWIIRTIVEHRRWHRASKVHTEVHNKLLDRFTANEDLLAYIQTPAGRRFLESAPIPLDSPRAMAAPLGRILWSAQAGAVFTVLGAGLFAVSQNSLEEVAAPLGAFGVVIIALGLGFVVSAALAYALTRRFGLLNDPNATPEARG